MKRFFLTFTVFLCFILIRNVKAEEQIIKNVDLKHGDIVSTCGSDSQCRINYLKTNYNLSLENRDNQLTSNTVYLMNFSDGENSKEIYYWEDFNEYFNLNLNLDQEIINTSDFDDIRLNIEYYIYNMAFTIINLYSFEAYIYDDTGNESSYEGIEMIIDGKMDEDMIKKSTDQNTINNYNEFI